MPAEDVIIDHIGAQGDGRFKAGEDWISVPFTLPGERVRIERDGTRARLIDVLEPSPNRAAPACPLFTRCGGCTLQHLSAETYGAFKTDQLVRALKARGLEAEIAPLWITAPGTRRRASFTAAREGRILRFGFHTRRSHQLIDVSACPVLAPEITSQLPFLRHLAESLTPPKGELSVQVTATPVGPDLSVSGLARTTKELDRMQAAADALQAGFARVAIEGVMTLTERRPAIPAGTAQMLPPPGGFLQASASAEAHLASLVSAHLKPAKAVADLFAGAGTFALRLAAQHPVHAVEGDAAAAEALREAARAPGLKPLSVERRDLFRDPLSAVELKRFDGLVLDPPRAGAAAQSAELAFANISRLAYVSCDPATLARDLRTLVDGDYQLIRVHPVDQFLWSAHVEAVALLTKGTPA